MTKIESSDDKLDAIGIVDHQNHERTAEEENAVNKFDVTVPVVLIVNDMKLDFLGRKTFPH